LVSQDSDMSFPLANGQYVLVGGGDVVGTGVASGRKTALVDLQYAIGRKTPKTIVR